MSIDFNNDIVNPLYGSHIANSADYQSPGNFKLPADLGAVHLDAITTITDGINYASGDTITFLGGSIIRAIQLQVAVIGSPYSVLASSHIGAAGTGYAPSNTITFNASGGESAATITVMAVNGSGGVLAFSVSNHGAYVDRLDVLGQVSTTGSGSGFVLVPVWGGAVRTYNITDFGSYAVIPTNPVSTTTSGEGSGYTAAVGWSNAAGQRILTMIELLSSYISQIQTVSEAKLMCDILQKISSGMRFGSRTWDGSANARHAQANALKLLSGHVLPRDLSR
jgi:hypothetical protein